MSEEIKNQQQRQELSDHQDLDQVTGSGGTPAPAPPPPKAPLPKSTLTAEFPSADHKDW